MKYVTTIDEQEFIVEFLDETTISVNGETYICDFDNVAGQPVFSLLVDGKSFEAYVYPAEKAWQVLLQGRSYTALVEDELERTLRAASGRGVSERSEYRLKAPMPGLLVAVHVKNGQNVKEGDVLIVLESMKMQNELRSPRDGVVTRLKVEPGDRVEQNETILSVV